MLLYVSTLAVGKLLPNQGLQKHLLRCQLITVKWRFTTTYQTKCDFGWVYRLTSFYRALLMSRVKYCLYSIHYRDRDI